MRMRKIGCWFQEVEGGRPDSGLYLEAVDELPGSPRYIAVSFTVLWQDTESSPLRRGEVVDMRMNPEDLSVVIRPIADGN